MAAPRVKTMQSQPKQSVTQVHFTQALFGSEKFLDLATVVFLFYLIINVYEKF
jgi:hypothetical protein